MTETPPHSPDSVTALAEQANAALEAGNYACALDDLNRAVSLRSDWFVLYFSRGLIYGKLGRHQQAIQEFSQAIKLNPKEANLYFHRAEATRKITPSDAFADYEKTLEIDPDHAAALVQRARIHETAGRLVEALTDYSRTLLLAPGDEAAMGALLQVGKRLAQKYTEDINRQPDNAELYAQRGLFLRTVGKKAAAVPDFVRAVELEPRNPHFWGNRGVAQMELGNLTEAISDFTQALKLDSSLLIYRANRALAFLKLGGKAAEALADLDVVLADDPDNSNYRLLHARANRAKGDGEVAAREFRELVSRFSEDPDFFDEYAAVLMENGDYHQANEMFGKALKLAPNTQRAYFCGLTLSLLGQPAAALPFYELVLLNNPYDAAAHTERGTNLFTLGRNEEALDAYKSALQANPEYHSAWLNRAILRYQSSDLTKALSDVNQAVKINPKEFGAYKIRALIHQSLNNPTNAKADYQKFAQSCQNPQEADELARFLEIS